MFFFRLPSPTSNAACARFRLGRKRLTLPPHHVLTLTNRLHTIAVAAQAHNDAIALYLRYVRTQLAEISATLLSLPVGAQSLQEDLLLLEDQLNSIANTCEQRIHSCHLEYHDIRTLIRASTLSYARKPP